jgi:hypothetical protein
MKQNQESEKSTARRPRAAKAEPALIAKTATRESSLVLVPTSNTPRKMGWALTLGEAQKYVRNLAIHQANGLKLERDRGRVVRATLNGNVMPEARQYLIKYLAEPLARAGQLAPQ